MPLGNSGSGLDVDLLGNWIWWIFVGLEASLLLVALILRNRIRLRTSLLIISFIANAYFFLEINYSIYHSTTTKVLTGILWPLANLAWLVWVWRSRTRKEMAEAPKPVIPPSEKRGKRQKASEPPPPAPKRPQADDVKPPTAESATLDLRKVQPKPDERKRTTLK